MNNTSKSSLFTIIGAIAPIVPVFGWFLCFPLIVVGFILAIVAMSKEEQGSTRALVSCFLAIPLAVLMGVVGVSIVAQTGGM